MQHQLVLDGLSPLDDPDALLSLYVGFTDRQIAEMCGVSESTVCRRRRRFGIDTHKTPRGHVDLVERFEELGSVDQVAAAVGLSPRTVRRRLAEAGVSLRRGPSPGSRTAMLNRVEYLEAIGSVLSVREVAELLALHPATVRRAYVRAGLVPPAPKRRPALVEEPWRARWLWGSVVDRGFLEWAARRLTRAELAKRFAVSPDAVAGWYRNWALVPPE